MVFKTCAVCGVTSETKQIRFCDKMNSYLCSKHYMQMYRNGKISNTSRLTNHDKNEYILHEDYAEIVLRNSNQEVIASALIDIEDVDKCKPYKWAIVNDYTTTRINKKNVTLHRFLLEYYGTEDIDHINRNKLDNRRKNLRIVPKCINSANNDCVGVSRKGGKKWRAYFQRYGKYYSVGSFNTKKEAIVARAAAIEEVERNKDKLLEEFENKRKTKHTGIMPSSSGRWIAEFWRDNKKHYVGMFDTEDEAINARAKALAEYEKEKKSA